MGLEKRFGRSHYIIKKLPHRIQERKAKVKYRFWLFGLGILVTCGLTKPAGSEVLSVSNGLGTIRAYPNPWKADQNSRPYVTIDGLPASAVTSVRIFTISGELVRTLSGTQNVQWDLRNNSGENVASGVYIYLLSINGEKHSGKIAVIR